MKKMLAIILVSLVLSGCEKNGSQNDLIINNTEEENVVMDENDDYYHRKYVEEAQKSRYVRMPPNVMSGDDPAGREDSTQTGDERG